jgi:hypothetical protein
MTIDAFLYTAEKLKPDKFAAFGQELAKTPNVEVQYPQEGQITVLRDDMPVFLKLIRPGEYGDWFLNDDTARGMPFHVHSIISINVSTSPIRKADIGLRLAIEIAAQCARRWPCALDNLAVGEGHKRYTREEILQAEQQGKLLE